MTRNRREGVRQWRRMAKNEFGTRSKCGVESEKREIQIFSVNNGVIGTGQLYFKSGRFQPKLL